MTIWLTVPSKREAMKAAVDDGLLPANLLHVFEAVSQKHFHGTYTAQVMMSEIAAVLNGADDSDLILPQAEACLHLVELFMVVGGTDLNVTALSLVYGDEEECKEHGLDWSRAEGIYGDDDGEDDDVDDEEDEGGYTGGFGGFSTN